MRRARDVVREVVQGTLRPVELLLTGRNRSQQFSPIFIVGPPRTGSTLLCQVLLRQFRFCYFSNVMMKLPRVPLTVSGLSNLFGGFNAPDDYASEYGRTSGWNGANQGLQFWTAWIPFHPHDLAPDQVSVKVRTRIRDSINGMQQIARAPFINKWPPNSLRTELLASIFPKAVFIRISRNEVSLVRSILNSRDRICQRGSGWFSVKPAGYEAKLKSLPPEQQVRWQIDEIERQLDQASLRLGPSRFFHATYEELIWQPRQVAEAIATFYQGLTGRALEVHGSVPASFESGADRQNSR